MGTNTLVTYIYIIDSSSSWMMVRRRGDSSSSFRGRTFYDGRPHNTMYMCTIIWRSRQQQPNHNGASLYKIYNRTGSIVNLTSKTPSSKEGRAAAFVPGGVHVIPYNIRNYGFRYQKNFQYHYIACMGIRSKVVRKYVPIIIVYIYIIIIIFFPKNLFSAERLPFFHCLARLEPSVLDIMHTCSLHTLLSHTIKPRFYDFSRM